MEVINEEDFIKLETRLFERINSKITKIAVSSVCSIVVACVGCMGYLYGFKSRVDMLEIKVRVLESDFRAFGKDHPVGLDFTYLERLERRLTSLEEGQKANQRLLEVIAKNERR